MNDFICPPECDNRITEAQNDIKNLSDMIFKDSEGGLRFDIRKIKEQMITKTHVWVGIVVIGIPLLLTGTKIWSFTEQADLKYQSAKISEEKWATNEARAKLIEYRQDSLKYAMEQLRTDMRSNTETILKSIDDLKLAEKRIREGGK